MGYRSQVPMIPSSDFIYLLEWLMELMRTVTYIYQFIKGRGEGFK